MNERKRDEVRAWLVKSQHDLGSARRLMEGSEPYLDTAVYHCQQAAEKALKAFLVFHDVEFGKTHDLTELMHACAAWEPAFASWQRVAQTLTPYATQFRYPGDVLAPEPKEAQEALDRAHELVAFVRDRLPAEVRPQEDE